MKKFKEKLNNYFTLIKQKPSVLITMLLPPFAVMVILLIAYAIGGVYPFGEKCIALCDMHQQVIPLIMDFKDILSGKDNLFLNMQNAAGMNLYGVVLFFIASPFTFLAALVPKADMIYFMSILTMLKMMCCAVTANIYFRRCHKHLNYWWGAALSFMYAMSGYAMLFFQNTIWLDVMYFFPILLIEFKALIDKKNPTGLIVTLIGMLVLNYYLSYMVVLFTAIYFGLYIFINRKREDTKGIAPNFIIGCVIAALMSAVVWIPSFIQYLASARGTNVILGLLNTNFFGRLFTNIPLLLCTCFAPAILGVLFGKHRSRHTRLYMILIILMTIPVVIEPINKMWHTGNYMSFPVRYGYITTMVALVFAAIKLKHVNADSFPQKSDKWVMLPAATAVVVYAVFTVMFYYNDIHNISSYARTLWGDGYSFTMLLGMAMYGIIVYAVLMIFARFKKLSVKTFAVMFAVVMAFESFFNVNVYMISAAYNPTEFDDALTLENALDDVESGDDFYRIKLGQSRKRYFDANLIGAIGYNTIAHYTSLTSEEYMFAMKQIGYSSYWMEVSGSGGTLLSDALMSIKYTVIKNTVSDKAVYRNDNFGFIPNDFYMGLGVVTDSDLSNTAELPKKDRLYIQEYMAKTLLGAESSVYTSYEPTDLIDASYNTRGNIVSVGRKSYKNNCTIRYELDIKDKQTLYFDAFDKISNKLNEHINDSFNVYVNGMRLETSFPSKANNGLLELGTFENQKVKIDIDVLRNDNFGSFGVYGLHHERLKALIDNAVCADMKVDGNTVSGKVTAKDGQYLFLSVPYDKGFKAEINGKEAEIYRSMGGFMAIRLTDGENDIRFTMIPKGFIPGVVVSLVGTGLLVLWLAFRDKLKELIGKAEKISRIGVYILCGGVIVAVYILPLMLCFIGMFIQR